MRANKRQAKYAVALASALMLAFVGEAKAATAIGRVSATVISEITSLPVVIRLQTSQFSTQSASAGFSFASFQPSSGGFSVAPQSTASLIGIDANGVVSFSVSGDSTSSYVVRSGGWEGTGVQTQTIFSTEGTGAQTQTVSPTGTASAASNAVAGLIVPAQALIGGSRLSIEISQLSQSVQGGNVIVEISYN